MTTVTLSHSFQIVIPSDIRRQLGLKPGQKLQLMAYEGHITLIPLRPMRDLMGSVPTLGTDIEREDDRATSKLGEAPER